MDRVALLVDRQRLDLRRLESLHHELSRILAPADNIDLLLVEFSDNVLDPGSAHPDASAHRIDFFVRRPDGDLGSITGLPRNRLDLYRVIRDLAYFDFEQPAHEVRVAARDDDFR